MLNHCHYNFKRTNNAGLSATTVMSQVIPLSFVEKYRTIINKR